MPLISTKVSNTITQEKEERLKAEFGKAISILSGKSERWLMLTFEDNCRMYFHGDNSKPMAFLEVKVLGEIDPIESEQLSSEICRILNSELGISPDCTYIKYEEVEQWGFNGGNF